MSADPTLPGSIPTGPRRVVIHHHDDEVQRWAFDNLTKQFRKLGKPRQLPHVMFGSIWSRQDGWTIVAESDAVVSMIPSTTIERTSPLRKEP